MAFRTAGRGLLTKCSGLLSGADTRLSSILISSEGPSAFSQAPERFPGLCIRSFHGSRAGLASIEVKVPSMGDSITEGTIASVLKGKGSSVQEDEPILQIETDKVTIDVRAPYTGVLTQIMVRLVTLSLFLALGTIYMAERLLTEIENTHPRLPL